MDEEYLTRADKKWLKQMVRVDKAIAAWASDKGRDDIAEEASDRADQFVREIGRRS